MTHTISTGDQVSRTWTFFEGAWHEGNVAIMGPRTHGAWMGSTVFDGARVFEGVAPDLDLHCARVNRSAEALGLKPVVAVERWLELVAEGRERFDPDAALYVRPMYWARGGWGGGVMFDPGSVDWCLCLYEAPMPQPNGVSITLSPYRRPSLEYATVDSKTGSNYPNSARALAEAKTRGFDNCLMRDMLGAITELANANVFMVRDGKVLTPYPNGTFLNGITRQRVIGLLRRSGVEVTEATLAYEDFAQADEIFSSGNFTKLAVVTRIDERPLEIGPVFRRARELYWDYAHGR
ncbi:MAG TPA: branched-chain amino acid aminotransferase [Caulobacteraceae bacterium]